MPGEKHSIFIEENSPRDGLQNEAVLFSVAERIRLIDELSECGFCRIQIGSFVSSRRVPQMAETERVFEGLRRCPGTTYSALVLNEKGLSRAIECGIEHVSIFVSASETHSRRNTNCSVKDALKQAGALISRAKESGLAVQAGVMNAFGCRFEGAVAPEVVMEIIGACVKSNADELSLADTSGVAHPKQMEDMIPRLRSACDLPLSLHLHDTYGFGLANVYAAWKLGIKRFDACCGGLGGCPFIPGAAGNVPTEDVVNLFESMGVSTGISLESLGAVVRGLENKLARSLPGHYARLSCGMEGQTKSDS